MININNSFTLARTKITSYKGKSLLTGCAMSVGMIMILLFLSVISGATATAEATFKSNFSSKALALVSLPIECDNLGQNCKSKFNEQKYRDDNAKYNIKNISPVKTTGSEYALAGIDKLSQSTEDANGVFVNAPPPSNSIAAVDPVIIQDFIFNGEEFKTDNTNVVPVIIPELILSGSYMFNGSLSAKEQYNQRQDLIKTIQGKTFQLQKVIFDESLVTADPSKSVKPKIENIAVTFKVVGMYPMFSTFMAFNNSFIIPQSATATNPSVKGIFDKIALNGIVVEFASSADRDTMVEDIYKTLTSSQDPDFSGNVSPLVGPYETFKQGIDIISKVGLVMVAIVIVLASLFIVFILFRVVSDSRREIGVFRAFGAQKQDIGIIFFSYVFILNIFSFVVSFVIAIAIAILLSYFWGDEFYYSLANLGGSLSAVKPTLLFLNFPPVYTALAFIFVQLVGFTAGLLPTISATRTDPINALRAE